jgi:uracil-DNA glycosylase
MRQLLELCWAELTFDQQMERTWITDSVLCSAPVESGNVWRPAWRECRDRFLAPQLRRFPHAFVIALGRKAKERIAGVIGSREWDHCSSVAPPEGNRHEAKKSWVRVSKAFHHFLSRHPD